MMRLMSTVVMMMVVLKMVVMLRMEILIVMTTFPLPTGIISRSKR